MSDKAKVKVLIGNDAISDDLIAFYLDSVTEFVLGYCNLTEIPKGLKNTIIEITAMRVRNNTSGSTAAIGEGSKRVAAISDGNQSISYQGESGAKTIISNDDIIEAYGRTLDRWRKMVIDGPKKRPLGARDVGSGE